MTTEVEKGGRADRFIVDYELLHSVLRLSWDRVEALLGNYQAAEIVGDPLLFDAQAQLYYIRGDAVQLASLLSRARPSLGKSAIFKLRESDLNVLRGDIEGAKEVILRAAENAPDDPVLQLERAFIDMGSAAAFNKKAWESTLFVASRNRTDVRLLLRIAVSLAHRHRPYESSVISDLIDIAGTTLGDFTEFQVLSAWRAVYKGELDLAEQRVDQALRRAPTHIDGNWLRVLLAKKMGDPVKGVSALETLLDADPYNQNVLALIEYFRNKYRTEALEKLHSRAGAMTEVSK